MANNVTTVTTVRECTLTTFDNPFDPFEEFTSWLMFDKEFGYNTCELLGRIVQLEDWMTQKEEMEANERAIDEFLQYDDANLYRKVYRKTKVF